METKITKEQRQSWRERLESLLSCHDTGHAEFTLAVLDDLDAAEAENEKLCTDKEALRNRLCGSVCHGDNDACFYQGGDTWNPCPLATEEDKNVFLASCPDVEE